MTRRIVWCTVLVFTLVVLAVGVFTKFEQVTVERWTPPAPEARRNSLLAFERFMVAMGRPLSRAQNAPALDKLEAGSALILDNHRTAVLSPARTAALLAWVEQGGYLIVAPERPGTKDPLLDYFDISCDCSSKTPQTEPQAAAKKPRPPESIPVAIPGKAHPLQVRFIMGWLIPGKTEPVWGAAAPDYPEQILHFDHGKGHVTVVTGLGRLLDNHNIGNFDHAELFWNLLETYQPDWSRPITLMSEPATPSLWEWLAESAWTALISGAALIGLWLWAVVPRFGQVRPEPEAARRELSEHLAAVGRYVWRAGGLAGWLETARASLRNRLALRHSAILALPPAEQAAALAELTRVPTAQITAALYRPAASLPAFTRAVRTLRTLENLL